MVASATLGSIAGSTAGAATAFNVDTNNRQLHPAEKKYIGEASKDKATQLCGTNTICQANATTYWTDLVEKAALSRADDAAYAANLKYLTEIALTMTQPGSEGSMGAAQRYLNDYRAAQTMLQAKAGEVILVNGQTTISYGTAQTYFSATAAQRADASDNVNFFSPQGSVIPNVGTRDANRLANLQVMNGSAVPDHTAEELLLGGAIGNKAATAAGKFIGELDVFVAGSVKPTPAGTVNAGKVGFEGVPVKLTAAEQAALSTLDRAGSVQAQGTLREIVVDSYFQRNGYKALDGKCGSGNCFDGVYIKGETIYINEVKPLNADGTIKLSGPSGALPTQMSDGWIRSAIGRLKEGTAAQREVASKIERAMNPETGTLVKITTGVNSNGMTIVKLK